MGTPYEKDIVARASEQAALLDTPSLKAALNEPRWIQNNAWNDAVTKAIEETGLDSFPEHCPWSMDQVLSVEFLPGD
jgi:hypothetical protein